MRNDLVLGMGGLFVSMLACGFNEAPMNNTATVADPGVALFETRCVKCHGAAGDLQVSGAKDLTKSVLTRQEMISIVTRGKRAMRGFGEELSAQQIGSVVDHVRTLNIAS